MKVLLIAPEKRDGTSWVRAWGPFTKLKNIELSGPEGKDLSWASLWPYDVCVWQRPGNQLDVVSIALAKKCGKRTWIDYDDYAFEVAEDNPAHDFYSQEDKKASMRECMRLADIVTVSTPELKKALLEQVPTADIRVIPNAVDDYYFAVEPSYHERNKTILIRGASGHQNDYLLYKDQILQILKENPDYTLSICGFHPQWLSEIPDSQLRLHQFLDIPSYFEELMQIRPEIMIVPLKDSKFNRCKSNIAFLEGTLAGASVIAPNLPEFNVPGCYNVDGPEKLVEAFYHVRDHGALYYGAAIKNLPKLSEVNELRRDILEELMTFDKRVRPLHLPKSVATQKQFHEYALAYGHTPADPRYQNQHSKFVEALIKELNPQTVVEYGSGCGGTLIELLKRGVVAYGMEYSPIAVNYFKENNPLFANQIFQVDITKEDIDLDKRADLGISIEVFEHINMPEEWWNKFIQGLSERYKHFYFTSTPYYSTEFHDHWWGHCNIRKTSSWIKLFEANGWEYQSNPKWLISWDLLFKSQN